MNIQRYLSEFAGLRTERIIETEEGEDEIVNAELMKLRLANFIEEAFRDKLLKQFLDGEDNNLDLSEVRVEFDKENKNCATLHLPIRFIYKIFNGLQVDELDIRIKC